MRHELFPLEELPPGEMRPVRVGSLSVVIIRSPDGSLRGLKDRCPHFGATLSAGRLQRMIVADDVGEQTLSDRMVVQCPWHGFEFDVETGRCPADPERNRVRAYTVTVEDGTVVLER